MHHLFFHLKLCQFNCIIKIMVISIKLFFFVFVIIEILVIIIVKAEKNVATANVITEYEIIARKS